VRLVVRRGERGGGRIQINWGRGEGVSGDRAGGWDQRREGKREEESSVGGGKKRR